MSDPGREALIKKWRQLALESWHHTVMTAYQTCVADLEAALQGSASSQTEEWQDRLCKLFVIADAMSYPTAQEALREIIGIARALSSPPRPPDAPAETKE